MGRAARASHPPRGAWALACGCSPRVWAPAGPCPRPRALCSSFGNPVLPLTGLGEVSPSPKTHERGLLELGTARIQRVAVANSSEVRAGRDPCPALPALGDVWPPGRLPLGLSASLCQPGIPAGGMGLGGCCGIRRVIPAGPSSLPVPLAPARPPASAELRRGSERWEPAAESPGGRPGHAGARSARPCSPVVPSTRPRWRRQRLHGQRAPQEEPGRSQSRLLLALRPSRETQGR